MCAVEQDSGAMARREPQDLSVTVELGLCHCSKLPDKVDNKTDSGNTRLLESMMMIWLECYR
jgi:hypothetical protein